MNRPEADRHLEATNCPHNGALFRVALITEDPAVGPELHSVLQAAGFVSEDILVSRLPESSTTPLTRFGAVIIDLDARDAPRGPEELLPPACAVITLAARDDLETRLQAQRIGAAHFLLKPLRESASHDVVDWLRAVPTPSAPSRILILQTGSASEHAYAQLTGDPALDLQTVAGVQALAHACGSCIPDVLIIEEDIGPTNAADLVAALRQASAPHLSAIVLDASDSPAQATPPGCIRISPRHMGAQLLRRVHELALQTRHARNERAHLERAIYERHREQHALNEHAIVSVADATGRIVEVNERFCTTSGYRRDELLGQNHRVVKSGQHPPEFYQDLWEAIASGHVWHGEICNRRKDGSLYWVESTITPFLDSDGLPYQYVSIRTDITHVKATEGELRRRNAIQHMITRVATGFLGVQPAEADAAFDKALKTAGRHLHADRAYLFLYSDDRQRMTNTHEWCAPGIEPQKHKLQDAPLNVMPWATQRLEQRTEVAVEHADQLPADASADLAMMQDQGIQSVLLIPMQRRGVTIGFLGFDAVTHARRWDPAEIAGLRVLAHMLANTLTRHRSEALLRQRETELRLRNEAIESAASGILIVDARQHHLPIIHVNRGFEQITGFSAREVAGHNCRFLRAGDEDQAGTQQVRDALREGHSTQVLLRNYRKDGTPFWNELRLSPVRNLDGELTHFVGIIDDVTERIAATQALSVSEQRLRRSQTYARIGTWEWDLETNELLWTDQVAPLFGHPDGQISISYERFLQAIHPDDRQAVIDAINAALSRDEPYSIEHRVIWPDGQVRWLLERGAVVRDDQGRARQMLGVVQDIDERKRTELTLAERELDLREAQAIAHVGSWVLDFLKGTLTWSDETYRIFGYEPGSIEPSIEGCYAAVHCEDRELLQESEQAAAITGQQDVTHRILRPDGSVRHVHELAHAETDADGNLTRLSGTVQDVTEEVESRQALIRARNEANRASRAKSMFLSSMSHELRTPLNAILGFGQLLEQDESLGTEQQENVDEILQAGRHLLDLINEVLDLARVESGRVELSLGEVDLEPLVSECLQLVQRPASEKGLSLETHVDGSLKIWADRTRLKQVLLNLISNAVKYNHDEGTVRIEANTTDTGEIWIVVSDTGPGIAPEQIDEVFKPFERLGAETTTTEGTGIGLTITQRLVEMMQGRISVSSKPGSGTRFEVRLPGPAAPETSVQHAAKPARETD